MWENILASSIVLISFIMILVIIYGIFSFSNVKKQKNRYKEIHTTISQGQKVVLANGIYGKVKHVNHETIDLEVKSGAVMTVSRYAISQIIKNEE
ncbi:preprotein translocase subunit YajC [Vagococcus salmoninarum]|uniref:preprotein translocase subunit YajC n=1 Tax=Vagococcus salmoninarum TaxID=2739 RepID=UPI003F9731F8